jgi:L-lactate dehydrogenase complex protein LldE
VQAALFITCLTDNFYPRSGVAVVKVLEHLGVDVAFPAAQTCCGQPMYNNGFQRDAREVARHMIRVFAPYARVITPSGSCASMVREHYPALFDDPRERKAAADLAERTREFTEFLVQDLRVDLRALGARWDGHVTYHYTCHLRGLGVTDEVLQVLDQIDGLTVTPLEKAEQCCGFGGTFAVKYPRISGSMVQDKVQCIAATGAATVVSNDAGCTMNLAGACRRGGHDVGFTSLAEIVAESLGLLDGEPAS